MYGIFDKKTGKLDCDPEPMVFDTRRDAYTVLYNMSIYQPTSDYEIREVLL